MKNVKTVRWYGSRSKKYINRFGSENALIYRIGRFVFTEEYKAEVRKGKRNKENISKKANRYGEKEDKDGEFKYTSRHILGIYSIAWKIQGSYPSRDDIDLINPSLVKKWTGIEIYILVL